MRIIAVIPARGGSVGIPNKNIKKFCGKPLIAWAILSALGSKNLDRVIVSTDSPEIAKIARQYGAEVPFIRPAELATNVGGLEPVIKHAYEWLKNNENYYVEAIAFLPTTNPLRQSRHIDEAVKIFIEKKADSVVSVNETPANHTPFWTLVKSDSSEVKLFGDIELKHIYDRRQDFPQKCFARNDLIYLLKPENLYDTPPRFYGKKVELYEISPLYEVDINNQDDWEWAEHKFKKLNNL